MYLKQDFKITYRPILEDPFIDESLETFFMKSESLFPDGKLRAFLSKQMILPDKTILNFGENYYLSLELTKMADVSKEGKEGEENYLGGELTITERGFFITEDEY